MKWQNTLVLSFLILSLLISTTGLQIEVTSQPPPVVTPHNFYEVVHSINQTLYKEDIKKLSSFSRFTGYPGFFETAEFIAQRFRELGLQTYGSNKDYFEWFNITTFISKESWILGPNGINVTAFPLYQVNPSPYDSGDNFDTLVYVGNGQLENFDKINVSGKFVLMNFMSSWNYYNAILFGAKGVIFIPESNQSIIRPEADQKLILLPLKFPRLYLPNTSESRKLLELAKEAGPNGIKVKIHSSASWEEVSVPNVVGYLPGSDPKLSNQIVVISAYYDSFSVVPALAYGATDALGVAELLQLAQYLVKNPPLHPVLFVALAGHYQALWGAREFIERHFSELGNKIISFIGMDLASESNQTGIYALGAAYSYNYPIILSQRYSWLVYKVFGQWLTEMKMVLGSSYGENLVDGILGSHPTYISSVRTYEPYLYGYFSTGSSFPALVTYLQHSYMLFDSEPFTLAMYGGGFTFHTTNAFRTFQRTPADTYENINFSNVWPQLQFVHCVTWAFLNEREIKLVTSPSRISDDWGYVTLNITVTTYNMLTSYYDKINFSKYPELKDQLIVSFSSGGLQIIQKVDKSSSVIIHGLKPYLGGTVDVFAFDKKGNIIWTTDTGVWSAPGGKGVPLSSNPHTKIISIFKCASIFVPLAFQPVDFSSFSTFVINDARAHAPTIMRNILQTDCFLMAFVQPGIPNELILSVGTGLPSGLLINASESNPSGSGYILKEGDQLILTPIDILRDMYYVTKSRYQALKSKLVIMPVLEYYSKLTEEELEAGQNYLNQNIYSKAYGTYLISWALAIELYYSLMNINGQVILSVAVFFLISLIFSLFIERLLFGASGTRRLLIIMSLLIFSNVVLYVFHPAYTLASNWIIILLATTTICLVLILAVISVAEAYSSAKTLQEKSLGKHFVEISRSGLLLESVNMAIENLKKRKLRTTLALTSITVIVFSVVVLASVSMAPILLVQKSNIKANYSGIEVRNYPWAPVNGLMYDALSSYLANSCYVAPRGFMYPPPMVYTSAEEATGIPYIAFSQSLKTQIYAILALSPQEDKVSNIGKLLLRGRWFNDEDLFSVILPESIALSLTRELNRKVDVNSTINLWGIELRVVGIISDKVANFTNPDAEAITPLDPQSIVTIPFHITSTHLIIIPFALYRELVYPPTVANIAIKPISENTFERLRNELPFAFMLPIYSYQEKKNYSEALLSRQWISVEGTQFILIPAIIASATIFDIMLASVHERKKEIGIFTAVGMAPAHITASFITEALTYIIPSIFFGYTFGVLSTYILCYFGLFPKELYPNFSSLSILFVIALDVLMILISAIYPSNLAGRIAIPSLAKKWTDIDKGPESDTWTIPFPLVLKSKEEVYGFMNFVSEYIGATMKREGTFAAERLDLSESSDGKQHIVVLLAECRFAPYDLGIKSNIIIEAKKQEDAKQYTFSVTIKRVEGYRQAWRTSAILVMDELRKQLITWRSLSSEERNKYISMHYEQK